MKIEAGKRYVRRDGTISGVIKSANLSDYPFRDLGNAALYTSAGTFWVDGDEHQYDLIAEYATESTTIADGGDMGASATDDEQGQPEPPQAQETASDRDTLLRRSMMIVAWARNQCHPATCGEEVLIVDECDALMAEYAKIL